MHGGQGAGKPGKGNGKRTGEPEFLLKLELQSNPEALCVVRAAVERAAEVMQFREEDARAIVRSVDEALANVMRHAYHGRAGLPIAVLCKKLPANGSAKQGGGLEIVLEDEGTAPDPAKFKSRPLHEIRPGGLGLHFIRESMDVVEFRRKKSKNLLRLVKYLPPIKQQTGSQGE